MFVCLFYRNITEEDFGVYELRAFFQTSDNRFQSRKVTLSPNEVPKLFAAATIAWITIIVLLVFVSISLLIFWQFPYVKFYYKKYLAAYVIGK